MSQSGYTPIQLYYSTTAAAVPVNTNLANGELAINITDGKLYYKNNSGVVTLLAGAGGAGIAAGSNTQIQFNSSGSFGASANLTWDGTNLTSTGFSGPHNGTVGATTPNTGAFTTLSASSTVTLSGGTANGVAYLNGSKVVTSGSALTFDGTKLGIGPQGSSGQLVVADALSTVVSASQDRRYRAAVTTGGVYYGGDIFGGLDSAGATVVGISTYDGSSSPVTSVIFKPANTQFYINGSEQMRLTSTGLGIGTSSPAGKLQVSGDNATVYITDNNVVGSDSATLYLGLSTVPTYAGLIADFSNDRLNIRHNQATRATFDTSGNLGLAFTPSSWLSAYRAMQFGSYGAVYSTNNATVRAAFSTNAYINTSNTYTYTANGVALAYVQDSGGHQWLTAPSGTAGNAISFTQAMTLFATGRLTVGETVDRGSGMIQIRQSADGYGYAAVDSASTFTTHLRADAAGSRVGNNSTYPLIFDTDSVERARITSSGLFNLSGSGTNTATTGWAGVQTDPVGSIGISRNGSNALAFFHTSNASGLSGTPVGTVSITTVATLYNTTSDQRLKENIANADSASSLIDSLQVRKFDWKTDGSHQRYGFVAQELATVAPEAVHQPVDSEQMMAVDYSKLVPMLVKEIQSLRARVAQLESN